MNDELETYEIVLPKKSAALIAGALKILWANSANAKVRLNPIKLGTEYPKAEDFANRTKLIAHCISDTLYESVNITLTEKKAGKNDDKEAERLKRRDAKRRENDAIEALTLDFDLFEEVQAIAIVEAFKIMTEEEL